MAHHLGLARSAPVRQQPAVPEAPGFLQLAKLYLEGEGYQVTKKVEGRSFPGFLQAVRKGDTATLEKVYHSQREVTKVAMTENAGSLGGYLVPLDYSTKLMEVIAENSFVWPRANVIPMLGAEMNLPNIDVETVQAAQVSPFFGSVNFTWGSSQVPTNIAEPRFRSLQLKAWDLLGLCLMSNQFLMDTGPSGEDALIKMFGKAAAWYAEAAFFQGTGAGNLMPLGIINAPGTISVTRGVPATIQDTDISGMASHLIPYSWENAIWACSPGALTQIVKIPHYFVNACGYHDHANVGTLLGRPLFVTDKLGPLGSDAGDLVLFDPWLYVIGLRMQVLVDVSPHPHFRSFQTDFRIWLRLDSKPQVSGPITLADGVTQVSPYVKLV